MADHQDDPKFESQATTTAPTKPSIANQETPTAVPNPSTQSSGDVMESDTRSHTAEFDPNVSLEPYEWADLERRFLERMNACEEKEQAIKDEFADWVKVFQVWAETTVQHEQQRAAKRLKTRMLHVQSSEQRLEEKRKHYLRVVKAFEEAFALL
ncbi:hypothetical protein MMC25_006720 [Agyrium rufum]|nr:hypothetical protein [Agyrium rufum]